MGIEGARAAAGASKARGSVLLALLQGVVSLALLALASDPAQKIWQPPAVAGDLLALSRVGALAGMFLYLAASAWALARHRRLLSPRAGARDAGDPVRLQLALDPHVAGADRRDRARARARRRARSLGRAVPWTHVRVGCVQCRGLHRHRTRQGRALHDAASSCTCCCSRAPRMPLPRRAIAEMATSPGSLPIGSIAWRLFAVACAALAQAGLWVQTHLVTGVLLDALRGRRPTRRAAYQHAGDGLMKGAAFGGCFMLLIQAAAFCLALPGADAWLARAPLLGVALAGGLLVRGAAHDRRELRRQRALLPALRHERARAGERAARSRRRSRARARGRVAAVGRSPIPSARASGCWSAPPPTRASISSATCVDPGAAGASGFDLAGLCCSARCSAAASAAALGWYFDASQLDVVIQKFRLYAGTRSTEPAGATRLRHLSAVQQMGRRSISGQTRAA